MEVFMILDLPPTTEQIIIANASKQGINPEQYIISLLPPQTAQQRPASFHKVRGILSNRADDALNFRKELRDEWD